MSVRSTLALLLLVVVTSACSTPVPETRRSGELSGGTAKTSIAGGTAVESDVVRCAPAGTQTAITTGSDARGTTSTIDGDEGLIALSVELRDIDGFTGSYWRGTAEPPRVTLVGRTYLIAGHADGYRADEPGRRTSQAYSIQVAC